MKKTLLTSRFIFLIGFAGLFAFKAHAVNSLQDIKNFHFVSENLASSGMLELSDYQYIQAYGFKHVVNLIPGMQLKEKKHVTSLGMSYQQIAVEWDSPTLEDFQQFVDLMKSYGENKVYVHCQLNWRAASFVYLYRVTQLGISEELAKKDLEKIWTPQDGWENFIEKTLKAYQAKI